MSTPKTNRTAGMTAAAQDNQGDEDTDPGGAKDVIGEPRDAELVPCRYCATPIPETAVFCKECNNYQISWRTELKYWSGIVGLIALVVSGTAFSLNLGRELYASMFGQDLAIADFSTTDVIRIWNTSDTDIWITAFAVESKGPTYNFMATTNEVIEPNKVKEINLLELFKKSWKGEVYRLLNGKAGNYATDLTQNERKDLTEDLDPIKSNVIPDFLKKGGPENTQLDSLHGSDLFTFPCTAYVLYRRVNNNSLHRFNIPCIGTVRRLSPP